MKHRCWVAAAGIDMQHVPYKGSSQAVIDLLAVLFTGFARRGG